jgi:restriction system protein
MARRKKTSPAEDFMELVALLPWWAGVALALILYFVLHRVAAQQVALITQPGQVGTVVTQTIWKSLASVGQYIVPLICLAGAAISAWRRRERKTLVHDVAHSKAADALDGMSWREFEMLVGEAFRLQGYRVTESGGGGADGGIDLVLTRDGERSLVQCKQWKAFKVGVDIVRELYGVMAAKGAAGGFVVTSGRFTEEATRFASGRNVKLVDGPKLQALIEQALAVRVQRAEPARNEPPVRERAEAAAPAAPSCPACAKPMVKRLAKRGPNAGGEFWGCVAYPACKGARPLD